MMCRAHWILANNALKSYSQVDASGALDALDALQVALDALVVALVVALVALVLQIASDALVAFLLSVVDA